MRACNFLLPVLLGLTAPASAQEVVYVIRHAEKEAAGDDPGLTPTGQVRAAAWAGMLSSAELDTIITSDARRTRETGAIIADALGLPVGSVPKEDISGIVDMLQFDHAEDRVLVVGHTETIPGILSRLGATDPIQLGPDDYDTLFILTGADADAPRLMRLHMP